MKQIQTQEFEQLIRNICAKNADFREGIRQVKQTATLVQTNLEKNNFVDVLDSIELKVERIDNYLTQILTELEGFTGVTFSSDRDLFGKRADRDQIDKAIETFARLVREIENYRDKRLRLTDYFDFLIRVHENGHDMGWRKSLDHIGSTGTDYLVKMLIYLSLIEVYRERAIYSKAGSTVHCVLDETGVLAPKYIRSVLEYAKSKGIILITAVTPSNRLLRELVRVRKRGLRFGGNRPPQGVKMRLTCAQAGKLARLDAGESLPRSQLSKDLLFALQKADVVRLENSGSSYVVRGLPGKLASFVEHHWGVRDLVRYAQANPKNRSRGLLAEIAGDSKALPNRPFDGIFVRSFQSFLASKPLNSVLRLRGGSVLRSGDLPRLRMVFISGRCLERLMPLAFLG